ncbi:MAG TPA: uroporphyrinogen decarboxylase family protein [Bacillota bacterium]|jgi:uroporphyrinogen decarboxylase|nr:uroporphyrinogen decarboxylase family protein [Bacillota bacterium]
MDSRERVKKTLAFEEVDRPPRDLWTLPGTELLCQDDLEAIKEKYPPDIAAPRFRYGQGERERGRVGMVGEYVDEWGCRWQVSQLGLIGEVKEPPLRGWQQLRTYKLPWEVLKEADLSEVNRSCEESSCYILAPTRVRPFERLQFLRGTENVLIDLALGTKELFTLLEMLHEYYLYEIKLWAQTAVDGVFFMDDWGSQTALLISPKQWREIFKPLYREYCAILREAGKAVFFHSDGNIEAIYPDLIEIGVNAINSQLFCMDLEKLGSLYAGKVVFWGEIDRQHLLPFGTPEEVRAAVRRVQKALGNRGVIAQCEWGLDVPRENIEAVFEAWQGG